MREVRSCTKLLCWLGVIALGWGATSAYAQSPLQDFQKKVEDSLPKGRFLKRLRDELRGEGDREEKEEAAQREREEQDRLRRRFAETDNSGRGNRFGTPGATGTPTPARSGTPSGFPPQLAPPGQPAASPANSWLPPRQNPSGNRVDANRVNLKLSDEDALPASRDAGNRRGQPPEGFGLMLEVDRERVVVVDVERKGNAFEAGIRKGDVIEKMGGMEIRSIDEFDQLTSVMRGGDQIEMTFNRRGKSETVAVTFGTFAEPDEPVLADDRFPNSSGTPTPARSLPGNDFAPPQLNAQPDFNSLLDPSSETGLQSIRSNENRSSLPSQSPMSGTGTNEVRVLQQIIERQQQQIDRLQREIDSMKRGTGTSRRVDPPLGT